MTKTEVADKEYENYLKTRNDYLAQQKEQIQEYARHLMLVSCGIFSISFIFIDKIITPPIKRKIFILIAWISFSAVILFVILSYLMSYKAFKKEIQFLDSKQKKDESKVRNYFNAFVMIFNVLSLILFIVGLVFLFLFAYNNL